MDGEEHLRSQALRSACVASRISPGEMSTKGERITADEEVMNHQMDRSRNVWTDAVDCVI
ncbi:MAG: hypothetical protein ACR2M3_01885 [Thermomicrobiales bacterium]